MRRAGLDAPRLLISYVILRMKEVLRWDESLRRSRRLTPRRASGRPGERVGSRVQVRPARANVWPAPTREQYRWEDVMGGRPLISAGKLAVVLLLSQILAVEAAEIKVIASTGVASVVTA